MDLSSSKALYRTHSWKLMSSMVTRPYPTKALRWMRMQHDVWDETYLLPFQVRGPHSDQGEALDCRGGSSS